MFSYKYLQIVLVQTIVADENVQQMEQAQN